MSRSGTSLILSRNVRFATVGGAAGGFWLLWGRLWHFHREPKLIALWLKLFGWALRWLTPARRRLLLALAALYFAVARPWEEHREAAELLNFAPRPIEGAIVIAVLSAFVALCYLAAKRFATLPAFVKRRPQICLHALILAVFAALWIIRPVEGMTRSVLIGVTAFLPFLAWRIGYMLMSAQRGRMQGTRFTDHFMYLYPAWGGSNTPYGKGWDYLSANEAKDAEALARSQLAGIRLLALATLLLVVKRLFEGTVFNETNLIYEKVGGFPDRFTLSITRVEQMFARPDAYPLWMRWASIYCELFWLVLHIAVRGHVIVASLRLAGFHVFRNTYKPLLAESVVEFWNRYYFYFKELLAIFFFYPAFTRHFKKYPRLRIVWAVFAAAFFGNMYYHCLASSTLPVADFGGLWALMHSRLVYCFLLATGISISMLRQQARTGARPPRTVGGRAVAIFGVWTFFALIHLWTGGTTPIGDRARFAASLFGL